MTRAASLRICIDARLEDGTSGGVQQIVIGLADALGRRAATDEEYLFLAYEDAHDWLSPYLGAPCRILEVRPPRPVGKGRSAAKATATAAGRLAPRLVERLAARALEVPVSDGTVERSDVHVLHFPTQSAFLSTIPSIYQPHDLQHLHFPELFSAPVYAKRELLYRTFCGQAAAVVMMTRAGRADLLARYGLPAEKVYVVPGAAVLDAYPKPQPSDLVSVRARFGLPDSFLLYPAQTWPHKNHAALFEALARAGEVDGIEIPLVCTGTRTPHARQLDRLIRRLGLAEVVTFTGFVSPLQLNALYRLARGLVFPSLFEGWGMPVTEAFAAGVPVACSDLPVLREQAGDAALFFVPTPDGIARAVTRLWTDQTLRDELVAHGGERVRALSWDRTARIFRAHYRRLGGAALSEEDTVLLSAPVLEPAA